VVDRQGTVGSIRAKGLPSGHEREIASGGSLRTERRVADRFDDYGRVIARDTTQDLTTPGNATQYGGQRRYTHRYKYDSRYGRLLGEAWPNGVGRGFVYSSIGAVEAETGHGDAMPPVLRTVDTVNALGQVTLEWLGDRSLGAALQLQRVQTLATGELESISYDRRAVQGAATSGIWRENYRFDAFGNLVRRAQQHEGGSFAQYEAYRYDLLQRMTQSSLRPFNGAQAQPSTTVDLGYDVVGNLTRKSDFSANQPNAYAYPAATAVRPNAVSQVGLAAGGTRQYGYDASGNLVCQWGDFVGTRCSHQPVFGALYNHNQQPVYQRRKASGSVNDARYSQAWYSYGADQQPARQWGIEGTQAGCAITWGGVPEPKCYHHRIYLDRYEDTVGPYIDFHGGERIYRARAYIGDYLVATRGRYGELELSFLLRDRLGSVVGVESTRLANRRIEQISAESRHGFDAYGAPRSNRTWNGIAWTDQARWYSPTRTQQGFTGHERLSGLQLIHMKGRVFDPVLGRFHGVDPIIQFPLSSQGLNPYSYILNNPMAGVTCRLFEDHRLVEGGSLG
jgi:RHS repeat-associated protein